MCLFDRKVTLSEIQSIIAGGTEELSLLPTGLHKYCNIQVQVNLRLLGHDLHIILCGRVRCITPPVIVIKKIPCRRYLMLVRRRLLWPLFLIWSTIFGCFLKREGAVQYYALWSKAKYNYNVGAFDGRELTTIR